jgi:hypothetical protein
VTTAAARVSPAPRPTRPTRPARTPARPAYLRLVAARRSQAAKAPFIMVVVGILGAGLLGLLLLNTVLAQDAFRLHTLQLQSHALADQEQALQRDVERLQSSGSLAQRATALGMVPGGPPAFLRLSDGTVLGAPAPGRAPVVPPPAAPASTPAAGGAAGTGAPKATGKPAAKSKPAAGTWVVVPPTGGRR